MCLPIPDEEIEIVRSVCLRGRGFAGCFAGKDMGILKRRKHRNSTDKECRTRYHEQDESTANRFHERHALMV